MRVTQMAAPLGAIVEDIDIRVIEGDGDSVKDEDVNLSTWQKLNQLFCQYHVLVFRNQDLQPDDHIAFARRWGELVKFPYGGLEDHPDIIELKNRGKSSDVNQHWHTDMSYNQAPPKLTMLYAHAAPEFGGDTAFSNQHLAYQDLSEGLKATLQNTTAFHTASGLARLYGQDEAAAPKATHPVLRSHDESGDPALYVCRAFTRNFTGWSREESKPLLDYLFSHSTSMEYQARHHWQAGDLVMWDNRSVLHYAVHDHGDDERVIHRLQVVGESTL
ncbi:MAG: TauD/TfdA family dioxygenase [bacterium]|nr:TauD/TfdA family dioxygenase [Gammaproteobacteria bacterium]